MASAAELIAPGVRVRIGEGWTGRVEELHGIFVTHLGSGLTLHVRGWRALDPREELFGFNSGWKGPPTDVVERVAGSRRTVAGTFPFGAHDMLVREWFIVDGDRGANAATMFKVLADLEPLEPLVDSIELI